MSDTLAARTAAWRSSDRRWAPERVELTLGSMALLPPVVPTGQIVGPLRSPVLRRAGVLSGEAVTLAGGHDHPIGGWGIEQAAPRGVLDSMGTAEVAVASSPDAVPRPAGVDTAPGTRSSGTTLLRVVELSGNVRWASQDPQVAESIAAILAGTARPSALEAGHFLPGRRAKRPRYAVDAPADPLARASAVLGALAVAGRDAVAAVARGAGAGGEVRLAGGWARSPGWVEIKSAINRSTPLVVPEPEVTAVSAALLAATAIGWTPDPRAAFGL